MKLQSGRYQGLKQRFSPHFSSRPQAEVSLLVIHNISLPAGEFLTPFVDHLFMGCIDTGAHQTFDTLLGLKVSAHFFINRLGIVTQYVATDQSAWHAGVSNFKGREGCNDYSLGIEMEGTDDESYTLMQYCALGVLTRQLMNDYPLITKDRIVGHCDIAPGRKTDPGSAFDWSGFKSSLKG